MNKRRIGAVYEEKAARYLERQGYVILERNYRCCRGEIDLIARDGSYLVFVEVKFRSHLQKGCGLDAVDGRKQRRIILGARWYLMKHRAEDQCCRFDVVSILDKEITLIKDAFQC